MNVPSPPPLHSILDDPEAFAQRADELRDRRSGFPDSHHPLASLLDALVFFFKVPAETTVLEATSTSRRSMADVKQEEHDLMGGELERAREALPDFEMGLRRAHAAGAPEVTFDSRDPAEDRVAGGLITYLVSTEFATVRTEDLDGERYRYHIGVNWPLLDDFARRLDIPLSDGLSRPK